MSVHDAAHQSLVTFEANSSYIRDVLIRMALANDSLPGQALFYALLAISSLRRNGLRQEAVHFKVSSLHALSKSAKAGSLGPAEAAQHVATCMLLCAFEVSFRT